MQPKDYVSAVYRCWASVLAAAAVGGGASFLLASVAPPVFHAEAAVFVSVNRAETPNTLGYSSLVDDQLLPSLAAAATSPAILQSVIDDLELTAGPGELARAVDVEVLPDTSVLQIGVDAADPARAARIATRVGAELEELTPTLYAGSGGSVLDVTTISPAREPRYRASPDTRRLTALGIVLGGGTAVLALGLAEALRPRVRTAGDVSATTGLPVLAEVHRRARRWPVDRRTRRDERAASLERVAGLLRALPDLPPGTDTRVALVGTGPGSTELARDLDRAAVRGGTARIVPVPTVAGFARSGTDLAGVLVATDSRRTTRRQLERVVAAVSASPVPLLGIVLDRRPAPRAGRLARAAAVLRGEDLRAPARSVAGVPRNGVVRSTRVTAVVALLATGLAHDLPAATNTTLLAAVLLLPVWIGVLRRSRGAMVIATLTGLALLSGLLLAGWSSVDHDFAPREAAETSFQVLAAVGAIGLVLWARTVLPFPAVGVAYGLGQLASGLMDASASDNAYKFELSLPLTITVLALASAHRRPGVTIAALAGLALLDIAHDARSAFGFCVMAGALVLWQARPTTGRQVRPLATAGLLAIMAVGAYSLMRQLLVSGALGAAVQARTITQIEQTGTLLLGGRPEWTATWALMHQHPLGFGLGTVPSAADIALAKAGFAVTHIPSGEGYIENYMFAGRFELHSIVADLWSNAGPVGLLLGLVMAALLIRSSAQLLSRREASGLTCFLLLMSLWYLAFGPLPANLPDVALALGLVLPLRRTADRAVRGPGTVLRPSSTDRAAEVDPVPVRV
ncbi:hypothetical protein O2W18_03210 [Modestobacter sp. VKM Ac-2983]|uniref:hypothetical protein n=1 Tax=Modestobacter sp. VKM Ac-2983 TaxID=3004137 RepID=UPI0022AB8F66|nr:hypothetical protein [Modestobacter sp. VKM Ac-2983]MCZ2804104.1 hypothetical protein [Modestobacter sp. VKM Ac-2983]